MHSEKILVIGSKGHALADRCVDWLEPFPYLGDYTTVVINMQSLTENTLKILGAPGPLKFRKAREELSDAIWYDTRVFCITQKNIALGRMIENYDWCPINFSFEEREGSGFAEEKKEGYLSFVKRWNHFLSAVNLPDDYKCRVYKKCRLTTEPLLTNLAGKSLAFYAHIYEFNLDEFGNIARGKIQKSQPMRFLPPTTEIPTEEGINFLLENIVGYTPGEIQLPDWAKNIPLPGEKESVAEIGTCEKEIKRLESEITKNRKKLDELNRYKALLAEDGETLEALIEEAMEFLGVKLERGPIKKEDYVFREGDAAIPIEIKGRKASIPESDLRQVIARLTEERSTGYKTRGVLIGNHYKETALNEKLEGRKKAFEPNVIDAAKSFNICVVSTLELFKVVQKKLTGETMGHFKEKLFNTIGEFTLEENVP